MKIKEYLDQVSVRYSSGISKEHSYRSDLELLLRSIAHDVEVTNEPSNVTNCGNPDFVITKKNIPIGYIEAKDIGKNLNSKSYMEQFNRYKSALDNLIITNYIEFKFYIHGELVHYIKLAEIENNSLKILYDNFEQFELLIKEFCSYIGITIKSSKKLAKMMAGKATLLRIILENAVTSDEETQENTSLKDQYESFRKILIHDLTPQEFADIYAQTLAYGMFAARLNDNTLDGFDRREAAELIPKTNPFLRKLFQYIAGYDIDDRIKTTVDNLAEVFRATDIKSILNNFGKETQRTNPIIHFYETFLGEYNPKLRKTRGVYYTPEPIVKFMVEAVDYLLVNEFNLEDGIADTSKITIKTKVTGNTIIKGKKKGQEIYEEHDIHKVQLLDPATGTGTFLAEIINYIYKKKFINLQGIWSEYVKNDLIPRLNGFEILMASYSMAHLQLDLLLSETGFKSIDNQRFNIYLTNSLEEEHPDTGTIFASWLSDEANEANFVKRDTPIMVMIGNPPYSVSSMNKSDWIQKLIEDYKINLNEKKINLDDDYIKFIRYGHKGIEKNGEGILAYITNNSFLSGVTHRRMRKYLMETFDKIFILDLHGNSKQKERSPDGSIDQNVFDITQGVSINIFVKTKLNAKEDAKIFHTDLYGTRKYKYDKLNESFSEIKWDELKPIAPYYFFTKTDMEGQEDYQKGFSVNDLFIEKNTGIQTKNDKVTIQFNENDMKNVVKDFKDLNEEDLKDKYSIKKEGTWTISKAKSDLLQEQYQIVPILFRPFDVRYTVLTNKSSGFLGRPRYKTMKHMLTDNNVALLVSRQNKSNTIDSFLITKYVSEMKSAERTIQSYHMPLYTYLEDNMLTDVSRVPNLDKNIINDIENLIDMKFLNESSNEENTFSPIDILDYVYATLYSNVYREKYKQLLKMDFPRIPYPKNKKTFITLVHLGSKIRKLHNGFTKQDNLLSIKYPISGDNTIDRKIVSKDYEVYDYNKKIGRVWINDTQYFEGIPLKVWDFTVGGYQPAQKWLKDRVSLKLNYKDIILYQCIINSLYETNLVMKEIDESGIF